MRASECRGCGKPIVWCVEEGTGKKIPLDPRAPVYEVVEDAFGKTPVIKRAKDASNNATAMVSHFATCPDADQFSASRKPAIGGQDAAVGS